jgi:HSP20 family protein
MRLIRYTYPNTRTSLAAGFTRAPWSGLETRIDRLFENAFSDFAGNRRLSSTRFPVDLYEDKDHTYVRAELPGVSREDVNVEIVEGYLTIAGSRKPTPNQSEDAQSFSFSRSLELPEEVQTDKVTAAFENGVLTITLPKREETKPRKISVTVK